MLSFLSWGGSRLCPDGLGQLEAEPEAARRGTVSQPQPASLAGSRWCELGHAGRGGGGGAG